MSRLKNIESIIKEFSQLKRPLNKRLSAKENKKIVSNQPRSLEAQLLTSSHAALLSSPLRLCTFTQRLFPSKMMCRFEVGWHPETEAAWAYPTTTAHSGKGYYIKLKKSVLEIFQKGGHKAAFRGSAVYRSDMVSHIENTLNTDIFNQLLQVNKMDIYPVTMSSTHTWTADHDSLTGYQCILLLDTDQPSFIHFNQIHNNNSKYDNVPSYNVSMIWSKDRLDKLKTRLKLTSDAVVINRSIDTVNLGASLYRRMLYSDS